ESVARDSVAREHRRDGRRRMSAARSSVGWGRRHRAVVRAGAAAAALAIAGVVGFSVTNAGQAVVSSVASGGSERSLSSMSPVGGTSGPASAEPIPLPADRAVPGISQASGTAGAERQAPLGPPGRNAAGDGAPGSTP